MCSLQLLDFYHGQHQPVAAGMRPSSHPPPPQHQQPAQQYAQQGQQRAQASARPVSIERLALLEQKIETLLQIASQTKGWCTVA